MAYIMMLLTLIALVTIPRGCSSFSLSDLISEPFNDPDYDKNLTQLVNSRGFVVSEHLVTTSDGYHISIFNVKCRQNCCKERVALIMPVVMSTSVVYVMDLRNNSLAYILADNGYDVWIGNARGSKFGRSSTFNANPSSNDKKFFDYYAYDYATKDVPAFVDYIRQASGVDKIFYVGSSSSTQTGMMFLALRPEYNDHIQGMALFGPNLLLNYNTTKIGLRAILTIYPYIDILGEITQEFPGIHTSGEFCKANVKLCTYLFANFAKQAKNYNLTRLPILFQHVPTATSLKTIKYTAQTAVQARDSKETDEYTVRLFDYDLREGPIQNLEGWLHMNPTNKEVYGTDTPPVVPLMNIRAPVKFYRGTEDEYVYPPEIDYLNKLPNVVGTYHLHGYGHMDTLAFTYNASHAYDMIRFFDGTLNVCTYVEGQSYQDIDKKANKD